MILGKPKKRYSLPKYNEPKNVYDDGTGMGFGMIYDIVGQMNKLRTVKDATCNNSIDYNQNVTANLKKDEEDTRTGGTYFDKEYVKDILMIKRSEERLRQEIETFDLNKDQCQTGFNLRILMGYISIFALIVILIVSGYIILNYTFFPPSIIIAASGAFFGDVIGLVVMIFKIYANPNALPKLDPVTKDEINKKGKNS